MKKIIAAILAAAIALLPVQLALAQVTTTAAANPSSPVATGVSVIGGTANSVLFAGSTGLLGSDSTFLYSAGDGIVIGHTAALATLSGSTLPTGLQIVSGSTIKALALVRFNAGTATAAARLNGARSKSGTIGTYTAVASGDSLFSITAEGADGTDFRESSEIRFVADGAVAANQVPGRIGLWTSTAAGTMAEGARLDSAQHLIFKGTTAVVSACGTSPTISGNDMTGTVTVGTGGIATSCTVTFATAWASAPKCFSNHQGAILVTRAVASTTALVIDAATSMTASGALDYFCTNT